MLLVSSILENAARVAPDAVAATLDDDAITFGEIEAAGNRIARTLAELGVAPGRPRAVVGRHAPRSGSRVRRARQARRGVRAAQRPGLARRGDTGRRVRPAESRARRLVACRRRRRAGAGDRRAVRRRPRASARGAVERTDCRQRGSTNATRTSSSSRAAAPGGPKGVGALAPHQLAAHVRGRDEHAGRRAARCACSRCSTWPDGRSRWAHGKAAAPCTSCASPTPRPCSRPPPATAPAGCIASRRCGAACSSTASAGYDLSTLVEADTGTSATPPELLAAIKDALPHTVTRVFYGSTEAGPSLALGDADLFRKPGSVGVAQPGVEVRLDERGEVCVHQPVPHGRLLRRSRRDRVRRSCDGWYHTGDLGALDDDGIRVDRRAGRAT